MYTAHLEKTPFITLFKQLATKEATGIGIIKLSNGTDYTLHIKDGAIVRITKSDYSMEKEVIALLKKSGTVSNEAFNKAEQKRLNTMRRMLDILMDSGDVSIILYSKIISALMRILLVNLLYEKKGLFTFQVKEKVKPFHSVRPITFLSLQNFHEEHIQQKKATKRVIRNMHNNIEVLNSATLPFKEGLSFFENYLSKDLDFFEFFTSFLFCLRKKRCILKGNFTTEAISDLLLRAAFRLSTLAAVILFVITVFSNKSYTHIDRGETGAKCQFCTMFKVKTATNFYTFSFDETPTESELLSSGLITQQDLKNLQLIQKQLNDTTEVSHDNKRKTRHSSQ